MRGAWRLGLLLLLGLIGQVDAAELPSVPIYDRESLAQLQLKAVLVAGDGSLPVFDNAVAAVAERLQRAGVPAVQITRLSAAATPPVTADQVSAAIAALRPAPGEGCLVYVTSHGVHGRGLVIDHDRDLLTPTALDEALAAGCGNAPTVVIASGCYSGMFIAGPMGRGNRDILTAAHEDRPSFGCAAGRDYTVYDRCLLEGLDRGHDWRQVHALAAACVGYGERREHIMLASEPQAHFGGALAPWRWPPAATP